MSIRPVPAGEPQPGGAVAVALAAGLGLVGVACLVLAAIVWGQRRGSVAAPALTLLLLAMSEWNLAYALFWAAAPAPNEHFWLLATYLGVVVAPTALLAFAARFSGLDGWITPTVRVVLVIEPVVTLTAIWLNPDQQVVLSDIGAAGAGVIARGGPVFWLNVAYSYLLLVVALVLLVTRWRSARGVFRQQATAALLGLLLPWVANLALILGSVTVFGADPTPITLAVTAFVFAYALLRFRMLDVTPVARHILIERMADGVVVLDARGRITDLNEAAAAMVGMSPTDSVGRPVKEELAGEPELVSVLAEAGDASVEVRLAGTPSVWVDLRVSMLVDHRHRAIGRLVVLRDISDRKRLERELSRLATTDPLTGVGNRRSFEEQAVRELHRARRHGQPLSLALLDLDRLKQLNDTYGHATGDRALATFARTVERCVRHVDVVARLGGDEFAVLMPDTPAPDAVRVVERIRDALSDLAATHPETAVLTLSAGVAAIGSGADGLDDLAARADAALYRAKQGGRDRVVAAEAGAGLPG